jgi:hypothetical protein
MVMSSIFVLMQSAMTIENSTITGDSISNAILGTSNNSLTIRNSRFTNGQITLLYDSKPAQQEMSQVVIEDSIFTGIVEIKATKPCYLFADFAMVDVRNSQFEHLYLGSQGCLCIRNGRITATSSTFQHIDASGGVVQVFDGAGVCACVRACVHA